MSAQPKLFTDLRVCCCCSAESKWGQKDGPTIVAVSMILYRRSKGKTQLKACKRVQICDSCLQAVLAQEGIFGGATSRKFLAAVRESLSGRYSGMLDEDGAK